MIRKIIGICGLMVLLALGSAGVAKADGVDNFTYTLGSDTFVWQVPESPSVDTFAPFGFMVGDVAVSQNGGAAVVTDLAFYSLLNGGGFDFQIGDFFAEAFGDQLYTGMEAAPTFKLGTFSMTDFGQSDEGVPGTLVISKVTTVPEPSTNFLLLAGSLGLLLAAKRKS